MIKKTAKSPKDLQTGTAERLCVLTWDNLSSFSPQTVCDIGVVVYLRKERRSYSLAGPSVHFSVRE